MRKQEQEQLWLAGAPTMSRAEAMALWNLRYRPVPEASYGGVSTNWGQMLGVGTYPTGPRGDISNNMLMDLATKEGKVLVED